MCGLWWSNCHQGRVSIKNFVFPYHLLFQQLMLYAYLWQGTGTVGHIPEGLGLTALQQPFPTVYSNVSNTYLLLEVMHCHKTYRCASSLNSDKDLVLQWNQWCILRHFQLLQQFLQRNKSSFKDTSTSIWNTGFCRWRSEILQTKNNRTSRKE